MVGDEDLVTKAQNDRGLYLTKYSLADTVKLSRIVKSCTNLFPADFQKLEPKSDIRHFGGIRFCKLKFK